RDDAVRRPVSVPRRDTFEKAPFPIPYRWLPQHAEKIAIELSQRGVSRLVRPSHEVRGNPLPASLELTLMKEPQPGREIGQDRRRLVHARFEGRCGTRLVMVLQEAGEAVLVAKLRLKMSAHRTYIRSAQTIIEPLVIGVVKALLQHGPLAIPIDLGHENK